MKHRGSGSWWDLFETWSVKNDVSKNKIDWIASEEIVPDTKICAWKLSTVNLTHWQKLTLGSKQNSAKMRQWDWRQKLKNKLKVQNREGMQNGKYEQDDKITPPWKDNDWIPCFPGDNAKCAMQKGQQTVDNQCGGWTQVLVQKKNFASRKWPSVSRKTGALLSPFLLTVRWKSPVCPVGWRDSNLSLFRWRARVREKPNSEWGLVGLIFVILFRGQ